MKAQMVDSLVVGFYNVENLFDTLDQKGKDDKEYLPHGMKKWNTKKYNRKIKHISRVINALNSWQGPDVIGLCEVENRKVLEDLLATQGLKNKGYKIIHKESPDQRGIDVCALYKPANFELISYEFIPITFTESKRPTREIAYIKGKVFSSDTIHVFFNHWPSRFGGEEKSRPKRMQVARQLKAAIDSIHQVEYQPFIVVAGDFNDSPENASIQYLTRDSVMSSINMQNRFPGTHKYQSEWNTFDQVLLSKALFKWRWKATVFTPNWLVVPDDKFTGRKPFRTYTGRYYKGGYSDHFSLKTVFYQ